ncbi:hypothetical protein CBM2587_B100087 [Cupriavidus taiwanensis]|uniref:Uncharacterized protein n=1 Tax=Cupriavidus taiwanensis TaxID=164546 RepID=A0A975X783_9BURK|nr:hypothetical protein CBM2587_B100087 [Cupriavidus taiwanensis]
MFAASAVWRVALHVQNYSERPASFRRHALSLLFKNIDDLIGGGSAPASDYLEIDNANCYHS